MKHISLFNLLHLLRAFFQTLEMLAALISIRSSSLLYITYKHNPYLNPQLTTSPQLRNRAHPISSMIPSPQLRNPAHPLFSLHHKTLLPLSQLSEELPNLIINHRISRIMFVLKLAVLMACHLHHVGAIWLLSVNYHHSIKYIFSNSPLSHNLVLILSHLSIKVGQKP